MKFFTAKFKGHYLPGTAAITANTEEEAIFMLEQSLEMNGLPQKIDKSDISEMSNTGASVVRIQFNGDY